MARALAEASQPEAGWSGQQARLAGSRDSSTGASSLGPAGLEAVTIASQMSATSAAALRLSIERAREAGRTWQELGDVLGVSRQAAFQRFGHPVDPRTGQAMSDAMLPGAADKATELMINWIEERYDDVMPELNELTARAANRARRPARCVGPADRNGRRVRGHGGGRGPSGRGHDHRGHPDDIRVRRNERPRRLRQAREGSRAVRIAARQPLRRAAQPLGSSAGPGWRG